MSDLSAEFLKSRRRLFGLAYRMLGSAADAEDIVQETYLRASRAGAAELKTPEAYFVSIASRLCLDHLKAARATREIYVGHWLPEPITDTDGITPESAAAYADDLSLALLMTLDRLSAHERAAFLLHDVFDMPYEEIAPIIDRSQAACRQLAARARKEVRTGRPARRVSTEEHRAMLMRFARAVAEGGEDDLKSLFADDAVFYSDGGGAKPSALNPIRGAGNIARFIVGIEKKSAALRAHRRVEMAEINGAVGFLIYDGDALDQSVSIETDGEKITAVFAIRNPAKLGAIAGAGRAQ
ncbi:MAG: RNA polymerase sigma factor SigJ [Pseudomonadota bacterium]